MADEESTDSAAAKHALTAYEVYPQPLTLRAAQRRRQWMDDTPDRFAYRCLPLAIVNQMGWELLCPASFTATWNGGPGKADIEIAFHDRSSNLVSSHFGNGVLTFTIGLLFRTPPGHNLWVKGPANAPKDGATALEALVETDWAVATFTMNWKLTRADHPVNFEQDEPICTILPYPRSYLGEFDPEIRAIEDNPPLQQQFQAWSRSRAEFIAELRKPGSSAQQQKWQRDYMQGKDQRDEVFSEHQTKINLPEFRRR